jgi:predicted cobalt transporter CbtA
VKCYNGNFVRLRILSLTLRNTNRWLGGLWALAVVAAAGLGQGRGVSSELEKMVAAKLVRVSEDGHDREGGGE